MRRPPDERVTRDVAREIAQREQLRAVVAGSIGALGNHYVIGVEAIDARTGDALAREQVEAASREQVLTSLGAAVSRLRSTLGESVASIERFDAPLARATTASLDALHAYSLALDAGRVNLRVEAIPHLQRAIELDPQFAMAQALLSGVYANTNRSADAPALARRAFELRDRVSERERFFISWRYYIDAAQDWNRALALAESWTATYPREPFAFNSLGMATGAFGRHEQAVAAFEAALRLDPRFVPPYGNLIGSLIALGRLDEARARLREARARGIDGLSLRRAAYTLAYLAGDLDSMRRALADARQFPASSLPSFNWEAHTAAAAGRIDAAHALFDDAAQQALRTNQRELGAQWTAEDAETHALVGQCDAAERETARALQWSRDSFTLERVARTLAVCDRDAASLTAELRRRFPDATLTQRIQLRLLEALAAARRDPALALDRLTLVAPLDNAPSAELWPGYLRGLVYLRMKDGNKAGDEFRRVMAHRSEAPASLLDPLATLGAARAARLTGDTAAARQHYQRLFALWSAADPTLAPLLDARREYAALR
jgi:tetratricopeptide (TPR) repeat protein